MGVVVRWAVQSHTSLANYFYVLVARHLTFAVVSKVVHRIDSVITGLHDGRYHHPFDIVLPINVHI